jgi:formylglycine-generating enzyme required for sulfatase activity
VTVNGTQAAVRGGSWQAKVAVVAEQDTAVTVSAVDAAGNRSQPVTRTLRGARVFGAKLDTGIGLTMVRIEPNPFLMGTPGNTGDESPHLVKISQPYWIGETEVTQGQWKAVMGAKNWSSDYEKVGDRYPATSVSWTDAVAFCAELTKRERAAGRLPPGYAYTLPSEAEWEYACRGGATTAYCFGDDEGRLRDYAVYGKSFEKGNSADPVRTKKPNAFGLYDMHGNVWEWCADYADYTGGVVTNTYGGAVTDPLCLSGAQRVVRGGCWNNEPAYCRSANRDCDDPSFASSYLGFRPALVARPPVK